MFDELVPLLNRERVKLIRFSGGITDTGVLLDHFKEVATIDQCDAVLSDVLNDDCKEAETRGKIVMVISREEGFLKREKEFQQNRIVVVYDIETVNKDENEDPINDLVVSISATVVRNRTVIERFSVTFNGPDGLQNYKAGEINRNEFSNLYENHITGTYDVKFVTEKMDLPEVTVNQVETKNEIDLITTWGRILAEIRPYMTVTFNGTSFDKPFLFRAGAKHSVNLAEMFTPMGPKCQFIPVRQFKTAMKEWGSEAPSYPYKHSGFIDNQCLGLRHDSFLPGIHQDLYKHCNSSLDYAAKKHKIELGKMSGVSYTEIPRMFYAKNPKLLEYNVQDTEVTTELYFKLIFNSKIYYEELEMTTGCPKESSASDNKTTPTKMTNYLANQRDCFVTDFGTNNKKETALEVMGELNGFFFAGQTRFKHDLSAQLVREYSSGAVNLRKGWSALYKVALSGCKTGEDIEIAFRAATNGTFYTTLQHLILVSFVRHAGRTIPIEGKYKLLVEDLVGFFVVKGSANVQKDLMEKECKKLAEFVYFVVITYGKMLSPFQNSDLLWSAYAEFKSFPAVTVLKYFYGEYMAPGETISKMFYEVIMEAADKYYSRSIDNETVNTGEILTGLVESYLPHLKKLKLEEKASTFDGAYTATPTPQFTIDQPVIVFDIVSSYPNNIIKHNISAHTIVDYDFVKKHELKEGKHFDVINAKRTDDFVHYTEYLNRGLTKYVDTFFGFLLKADIAASPFIKEYEGLLNARVVMKRSIATALTKEEAMDRKNKSDTMKVSINSEYGSMGMTFSNYTMLAYVTAAARRSILNSNKLLKVIWGDEIRIVYNDTDSAFAQFLKPVGEFAKMSVPELTAFFRGTTGVKQIPVTEEFVAKVPLCKACFKDELSVKLRPCGHIVLCQNCSATNCPNCGTEVKKTETVEMTDYVKVCYLLETVLGEYLIASLNACNGEGRVIEFELEKSIVPFAQTTAKKYIGRKPLENDTISTGTSMVRKSALGIQKRIMEIFLESFTFNFSNKGMVLLYIYHKIGSEIVTKMLDKTIDLNLVSKMMTHNQDKKQTAKVEQMIANMTADGYETPPVIKCREVCVEPIGADKDWSTVTVEQLNKNPAKYSLNKSHIMAEAMQEMLAYLTLFTAAEGAWFEALIGCKYDANLTEIQGGGGCQYTPPNKFKDFGASTAQEFVDAAMPALINRTIKKNRVLPVSFIDKRKTVDTPSPVKKKTATKRKSSAGGETEVKKIKPSETLGAFSLMRPFVVHMEPKNVKEWIGKDPDRNIYVGPAVDGIELHPLSTTFIPTCFSEFYGASKKYKNFLHEYDPKDDIYKMKGKTIGCTCTVGDMWCCCIILSEQISAKSSVTRTASMPENVVGTVCLDVDCISTKGTGTEQYTTGLVYPYIERSAAKTNLAREGEWESPGTIKFLPDNDIFWMFTRWDTGAGKSLPRRAGATRYKDTVTNRKVWLVKCLEKLGDDERCGDDVTFVCSLNLDEQIIKMFSIKYGKKVTVIQKE